MKELVHLFDQSYIHPSYIPGDPLRYIPNKFRASTFFVNFLFWFGFGFLATGTIFLIGFGSVTDFYSFRFGTNVTETTAKIVDIRSANYSENDDSFFEYLYKYSVNGKPYHGSSFATDKGLIIDSEIKIQYQNSSHSTSRIKGMRMAPSNPFLLLFLIIPLSIGVWMIIVTLQKGMDEIIILRHGIVTEATITENILIPSNDSEVADTNDIYIEFTTSKGKKIKTKINIETGKKARPGYTASIIYLPWEPSCSTFIRSLSHEQRKIVEGN